jgi:hypothetical protein
LPTGEIVVLNAGSAELRFYSSDGTHLRTVGRSGEGPGEFYFPSVLLTPHPDTLIVWDFQTGRLTWFTARGEFIRTESVDRAAMNALAEQFGLSHGGQPLPDLSWLLNLMPADPSPSNLEGVVRPPQGVAWARADLSEAHLIRWIPGIEQENLGSRERPEFMIVPFSRLGTNAAGGSPLRIYTADGEAFEVRRYRPDGSLEALIRKAHDPVRVTDADLAFWAERARPSMERRWDEVEIEQRIARVSKPSTMPPYRRVHVDVLGRLWVEAYPEPSRYDSTRFFVFDDDGSLGAQVVLAGRVQPLEIGPNYVLATYRDEDGVEFVRLYNVLGHD